MSDAFPPANTGASSLQRRSPLALCLGIILPLLALNGFFLALWADGHHVEEENGPMENLQAVFLLAGCGLMIHAATRVKNGGRILCAGLALFYLNFAVREMDFRHSHLPIITTVFKVKVRNVWLGALWLAALVWFAREWRRTWRTFRAWMSTGPSLILIGAGILWGISELVEKSKLIQPEARGFFVEEITEINACWLMFVSAVLVWRKPPDDVV